MKKVVMFLLSCMLMVSLTGCGNVTVGSLIDDANKKAENAKSMSMTVKLDMDIEIAMEVISGQPFDMNMKIGGDMKVDAIADGTQTSMKGSMNIDGMGMSNTIDMESYTVMEDNEINVYTKTEDQWTKMSQEVGGVSSLTDTYRSIIGIKDGFVLGEKTEKINDKDVYLVIGEIKGDDIKKILETNDTTRELLKGVDEAGIDFDKFSVNVNMWFDKKSKELIKMDGEAAKTMENMMSEIISKVSESTGQAMSIKVNKFNVEMNDIEHNKVKEIKIPDEAKDAQVIENGDSANPISDIFGGFLK